MAVEIAEAVLGALKGELSATAVNAPMVAPEVSQQTYCDISIRVKYVFSSFVNREIFTFGPLILKRLILVLHFLK